MPPTRSVVLQILGDDRSARSAVSWVRGADAEINAMHPTLKINADTRQAQGPMGALRTSVATLTDKLQTVKFSANDTLFNKQLAVMTGKLAAFQALADRPMINKQQLATAEAGVLKLAASFDDLMAKQKAAAEASLTGAGNEGPHVPGWAGAIANFQAPLFGGLTSTSGLHVLADSALELMAVLVPATVAVAAFGAALVATAPDLEIMYTRERAMFIASQALQQSMPGLSGNFKALADSIKPQTFAVWGDVLTVLNSNTGTFAQLAHTAINWVDQFAAKMTVDLTSGSGGFLNFVKAGVKDLQGLGTVFQGLGSIVMSFIHITQTTHIAEDLLGIVGAVVKLAAAVISFPPVTALLTVGIALHGIYLWGGLAVSGISKVFDVLGKIPGLGVLKPLGDLPGVFEGMATKGLEASTGLDFIVKGFKGVAVDAEGATVKTGFFKTTLAALSQVPVWGWVAVGVVALGGLVFWLGRSKDATDQWITSLNKSILAASNQTVFNKLTTSFGQVNTKLNETAKVVDGAAKAYTEVGAASGRAGAMLAGENATVQQARTDHSALATETKKLDTQMSNFGQGVGYIMKQFGVSYPIALAIADAANVKLVNGITGSSKAAKDARQEILGLMTGFEQLSTPLGRVGQDFSVLAVQGAQVTKNIQQVNSAWQQWMGTVTGGETSFDTFAQGMNVLNDSGAKFKVTLGQLSVKGDQSKAAIDDLSLAGLNLNAAFQQEVGNANNLIGALRSQGASNEEVTKTTKAAVAALLPFAKGSQEATSVLYGLAKQADYTGGNSIKALTSWAGISAPNAMKILKKTTDDSTKSASDLAKTLQNVLNVQFHNDIIQSSGASAALQKYTDDLVHNRQQTAAGVGDRQRLINDLIAAGLKADKARAFVDGLSTSLRKVPANTTANIGLHATGSGSVKITASGIAAAGQGNVRFISGNAAAGRKITEGTTSTADDVLVRVSKNETIVSAAHSRALAPVFGAVGVPGYATGGIVGLEQQFSKFPPEASSFASRDAATAMAADFNAALKHISSALTQSLAGSGVGGMGDSGARTHSAAVAQAYAASLLPMYHWGASQMIPLIKLWNQESGWSAYAVNPSSGAYGIPQSLGHGHPYNLGDYKNQIIWGLNYIRGRYGSPASAWSHEVANNWYKNGGIITEPILGRGLQTGQGYMFGEVGPEMVTPLNRAHYSASGGGGGVTYMINVSPTPMAKPADIGREVVKAIRAFERGSGKSWRS